MAAGSALITRFGKMTDENIRYGQTCELVGLRRLCSTAVDRFRSRILQDKANSIYKDAWLAQVDTIDACGCQPLCWWQYLRRCPAKVILVRGNESSIKYRNETMAIGRAGHGPPSTSGIPFLRRVIGDQ